MEIHGVPPVQETKAKDEVEPKMAVSAQENPSQEAAPSDHKVEAALGAAEAQEEARRLAELLKEVMSALDYTVKFEPQEDDGTIVLRVLDDKGNLVRVIPQSEFGKLRNELAVGADSGLLLSLT